MGRPSDRAVARTWLDELRERMQHCVSAADEGEDYAVPRDMLDAMTALGLMQKVGRGKWAPTEAGRDFAGAKPTLPVDIHGNWYEVPIPVQLHIVSLRDRLASHPSQDAEDAARLDWLASDMSRGDESVAISYMDGRYYYQFLDNGAGGSGGGVYFATFDTFREAIDSAMAEGVGNL